MISRNQPRPTKKERERIARMKQEIGCVCCLLRFNIQTRPLEIHHIVRGNKRLGHWYTLPLCRAHHQVRGTGMWTSIANGRKAFRAIHGDEMDIWIKVQHMLNLDDSLPATKVLPRRLHVARNPRLVDHPAHQADAPADVSRAVGADMVTVRAGEAS